MTWLVIFKLAISSHEILYRDELHDLCRSPSIVRTVKSGRLYCSTSVTYLVKKCAYKNFMRNFPGKQAQEGDKRIRVYIVSWIQGVPV
jgi:hypothetical protein